MFDNDNYSRRGWKSSSVRLITLAGLPTLFFGTLLPAQETSRFTFDVGGGFTQPVGNTSRHLDTGWNIKGGAGYNFNRYFGTIVEVGYNRFDINGATLSNAGFPGGNMQVFSATLDPIVHTNAFAHADVYIIGGGGLYRTTQEFTQPSSTSVLGYDPFFGFYNAAVPTTEILSSYSVNKPGVNIGAGVSFGTKWRGKVYAESRYNRIFTGNNRHADYIPVSFGYRW